mgnify:CR=1 FL=1
MPALKKDRTAPLSTLPPVAGASGLAQLAKFQIGSWKAMLKWQVESLDFLKHRCEQDIRFIDELMQTPEPGEMLSTYSCFLQNALDDYSREAVKAAHMSNRMVNDAARDFRHQAEALSEDMMAATVV